MMNTPRFAALGILSILSLMVLFHFLILAGLIPFQIVWGGRLQSQEQMVVFELFSIGINVLMLAVVSVYTGLLRIHLHQMILKVALWIMFALFLLNTVGNILSLNVWEKLIFTPITLVLALLSLLLALGKSALCIR